MIPTEFDFTALEPSEIPVKFRNKQYILTECSEGHRSVWNDAKIQGLKVVQDQRGDRQQFSGISGGGRLRALLLSGCLREVKENNDMGPFVKEDSLKQWPAKVVNPLYRAALEMNELEEEDDTEAGLIKQIADLQAKLQRMRDAEQAVKNALQGTERTFDTPENEGGQGASLTQSYSVPSPVVSSVLGPGIPLKSTGSEKEG